MRYLRFEKVTNEKIWGKEDWTLSAHEEGKCKLLGLNTIFADYYEKHKEQFDNKNHAEFPLLIKVISAKDDLSIQVHPNDEYARKHENSLGKQESWLVLDCEEGADIIVGQKEGVTKEDIASGIKDNTILDYLDVKPVKPGDFFDVSPGTIHAIRRGTTILEIQQSSDITYRLYDYDRRDDQGNPRELHVNKSLDVIKPMHENNKIFNENTLVENEFYYIDKHELEGDTNITTSENYKIIIPLAEGFKINGELLEQYEAVLVLKNKHVELSGTGQYIITGEER